MTSRGGWARLGIWLWVWGLLPGCAHAETPAERLPVRIGWQVSAATQAQISEVLKRTDVLEVHGIEPRLVPYSYGTPQIEAALQGDLDVVFAGDQPVVNLIARGGRWKIVSRLFIDRIAVMVPSNSDITSLAQLEGRTVASPFGSVGHREVLLAEQAAGLDPDRDVKNLDLDILEIRRRVRAGGRTGWEGVDAVGVWEPTASAFERTGVARTLSEVRTLGVVAFSEAFIEAHPEAAVRFLVALARAWHFFAQHPERVRQWYLDDAQLGYVAADLESAARVDPNFRVEASEEVALALTDADLAAFQAEADWARDRGHSGGSFEIADAVDRSLLPRAMALVREDHFEPIQVVLPSARETADEVSPGAWFFDHIPLWVLFGLMVTLSFLGIGVGQWLGRRRHRERESEGPIGTVVGAVLALLAFVIALTFAAAGSRFDARKAALLDEVNAIGTAYLRADLLPEPHRTTVRALLRDYVEVRLGMYRAYDQPDMLRTVQGRTSALQASLWSHAESLATSDRRSPIYALFVDSLNAVFDLHTTRVVLGAEYRIPRFVWVALALVSAFAMLAVGFQFGLRHGRSLIASVTLSVTFSLVVLLILDYDRPGEGLIAVNQQPMRELYQSLGRQ